MSNARVKTENAMNSALYLELLKYAKSQPASESREGEMPPIVVQKHNNSKLMDWHIEWIVLQPKGL